MAVLSSRVHERRIREIRAREDDRISSREKNKNLLFKKLTGYWRLRLM